jgi:phosphoribosylaminoimidazole-succinocarboxamide synthase
MGEHDENVTFDEVVASIGQEEAQLLRRFSLAVYEHAAEIADDRGLILADTKFEFGTRPDGTIVLADEILTPDSSRYWPAESWDPGHPQPSFDKQYVRDWLTSAESGWDRNSGEAPPPLPDEVVEKTRQKYIEAYERLTGKRFS